MIMWITSRTRRGGSGGVSLGAVGMIVACALILTGTASLTTMFTRPEGTAVWDQSGICEMAIELGLSPDVLSMSGVTAGEAMSILETIRQNDQGLSAYAAAVLLADQRASELTSLREAHYGSAYDADLAVQIMQAESALHQANSELKTAADAVVEYACASLSTGEKELVARIRMNSGLRVDLVMLAASDQTVDPNGDLSGWKALELAVIERDRCDRNGEALSGESRQILQAMAADGNVVQAKYDRLMNREFIVAAFDAFRNRE